VARSAAARQINSGERDPDADRVFIEEMAMTLEMYSRLPRTAGRIYALLLVSDRPYMSQAELADALGVSLASVSTMARRLVDGRMIERVAVPGERRDQYRVRADGWTTFVRDIANTARRLGEQVERGLALPGPDVSPARAHLTRLRDTYARLAMWLDKAADDDEMRD
jgi:DNA-binding MarR family transcriptional regulator